MFHKRNSYKCNMITLSVCFFTSSALKSYINKHKFPYHYRTIALNNNANKVCTCCIEWVKRLEGGANERAGVECHEVVNVIGRDHAHEVPGSHAQCLQAPRRETHARIQLPVRHFRFRVSVNLTTNTLTITKNTLAINKRLVLTHTQINVATLEHRKLG